AENGEYDPNYFWPLEEYYKLLDTNPTAAGIAKKFREKHTRRVEAERRLIVNKAKPKEKADYDASVEQSGNIVDNERTHRSELGRDVPNKKVNKYSGDPLKDDFVGPLDLNTLASKNVHKVTAPIDFDGHILSGEIKPNGNVVGGHSIASGNVRVIPGTESSPNAFGVYKAKIEVPDPSNPGQFLPKSNNGGYSTMFPDSWTADRIKVEVDTAFHSRTVNGGKWTGVTPSGVTVEGWMTPKTTVYPKL
ncbi:EndoU domain-containing protein, partial [Aliikangiella maris]